MSDQFVGQIIADKYRVESFLRASEMGSVFSGRHLPTDKTVAIKILSPGLASDEWAVRRFLDGAQAAARVSDPNVLQVSDLGTDARGRSYIIYEDAAGMTLEDLIERESRLEPNRAVNIAKQIAFGLAAAHAREVFHGDLSPENILVRTDAYATDHVKLLELGSGSAGPAEYLAPERFAGTSRVDARSDIYSVGVILYRMLAGEFPFPAETREEIAAKQAEAPPPPLSAFRKDVPADVELIVLKAIAVDPEMRYRTAEELAAALEAAEHSAAVPAAAAAGGNDIWKTAFVVLAGIAILAAALIYGTSGKRTDPATTLQTDANGQPVQPLNPATGAQEDAFAAMQGSAEIMANSNMVPPPGTIPGGDGYNPWGTGAPPPGAPPTYIGPGGQVITIDPNNPSQFMPMDGGIVLVPVPANTDTATVKPTPEPKTPAANTAAQPTPETKPQPSPAETKPAAKPPAKPPAKPATPPANTQDPTQ